MNDKAIRALLVGSDLLKNITRLYGWDDASQNKWTDSITESVSTSSDWRISSIHKMGRRHGLNMQNDPILDAGCGHGAVTIVGKTRGINIVGLDADPPSLDLARQLALQTEPDPAKVERWFIHGSVTEMPFQDGHFAMISSHQVIEHVTEPMEMLGECARCLRPGGILWLVAPDYRFAFEPHYRIPWLPFLEKRTASAWLDVFDKPRGGLSGFDYVSLPILLEMLKTIGFEILSATTSTPEHKIREELQALIGDEDYVAGDASQVRALAFKAKSARVVPSETSFLILCRKPARLQHPG